MKAIFEKEHIQFIIDNVKGISLKELTEKVNKEFNTNYTKNQIKNKKQDLNLRSGYDCKFKKGQKAWNEGKKMPKELYDKLKPTMFKKGNIPNNRRELYEEKIGKDDYLFVKVQDGHLYKNWIPKTKYIYEKYKGKVPEGYVVIFADGNKRNFDLDNLVLVSRAEELIMNRNGLFKQDKEMTKTGANIAKLINKTNKLKGNK